MLCYFYDYGIEKFFLLIIWLEILGSNLSSLNLHKLPRKENMAEEQKAETSLSKEEVDELYVLFDKLVKFFI